MEEQWELLNEEGSAIEIASGKRRNRNLGLHSDTSVNISSAMSGRPCRTSIDDLWRHRIFAELDLR